MKDRSPINVPPHFSLQVSVGTSIPATEKVVLSEAVKAGRIVPINAALWRLRLEEPKFWASLGYTMRQKTGTGEGSVV